MKMDQSFSENSQLLDMGVSKVTLILNQIASLREESSNLQLSMATLDDPELKRCMVEADCSVQEVENAMKRVKGLQTTIATFNNSESVSFTVEAAESTLQQGEQHSRSTE